MLLQGGVATPSTRALDPPLICQDCINCKRRAKLIVHSNFKTCKNPTWQTARVTRELFSRRGWEVELVTSPPIKKNPGGITNGQIACKSAALPLGSYVTSRIENFPFNLLRNPHLLGRSDETHTDWPRSIYSLCFGYFITSILCSRKKISFHTKTDEHGLKVKEMFISNLYVQLLLSDGLSCSNDKKYYSCNF